MIKKSLQIFILFTTLSALAQERQSLISGKIVDSLGVVKNVNIINLKTRQGTISFDDGRFKIFASEGDTLRFSTVQHITKKIRLNKENINKKSIIIKLKLNTYVLDEFDLKRNNLIGRLSLDIKEVPKDRKDSLLRSTMDFSNVNMKRAEELDYIDKRVKPQIVKTVPNYFEGAIAIIPIPIKDLESALRKELNRKKAVPNKILIELGEPFFFNELKIPKENYFHFLDYCNALDIEDLHKENKILELIKIFKKESVPYLKTIKKE